MEVADAGSMDLGEIRESLNEEGESENAAEPAAVAVPAETMKFFSVNAATTKSMHNLDEAHEREKKKHFNQLGSAAFVGKLDGSGANSPPAAGAALTAGGRGGGLLQRRRTYATAGAVAPIPGFHGGSAEKARAHEEGEVFPAARGKASGPPAAAAPMPAVTTSRPVSMSAPRKSVVSSLFASADDAHLPTEAATVAADAGNSTLAAPNAEPAARDNPASTVGAEADQAVTVNTDGAPPAGDVGSGEPNSETQDLHAEPQQDQDQDQEQELVHSEQRPAECESEAVPEQSAPAEPNSPVSAPINKLVPSISDSSNSPTEVAAGTLSPAARSAPSTPTPTPAPAPAPAVTPAVTPAQAQARPGTGSSTAPSTPQAPTQSAAATVSSAGRTPPLWASASLRSTSSSGSGSKAYSSANGAGSSSSSSSGSSSAGRGGAPAAADLSKRPLPMPSASAAAAYCVPRSTSNTTAGTTAATTSSRPGSSSSSSREGSGNNDSSSGSNGQTAAVANAEDSSTSSNAERARALVSSGSVRDRIKKFESLAAPGQGSAPTPESAGIGAVAVLGSTVLRTPSRDSGDWELRSAEGGSAEKQQQQRTVSRRWSVHK